MPREPRAYLADIIESCDAIGEAIAGMNLSSYQANRLVRSAVDREFIIIGEAMLALSRRAPGLFAAIDHARRIVDFRNQLTHEYPSIDDTIVWATADRDMPVLRRECDVLMTRMGANAETD